MSLRIPPLAVGAIAMLAGLCGGLWRLGWTLPHGSSLAVIHGPLLISGVFGTLISLERAVAMGRDWSYLSPAFSGIGTLLLLAGAPVYFAAAAYTLAGGILAAASLVITRQQPTVFNGALLLGALAWLAGNVLWLIERPMSDAVGWWLAFLALIIAGERLELSRLMPAWRGSEASFLLAAGLLVAGAQNGIMTTNGAMLFGLALVGLTAWLLKHDIARRNVRKEGQIRFMVVCMWAARCGSVQRGCC